ncbi:MAG: diaminopimelate epimerase [Planctomycetes bacterium]|nr:diaminopimelate epimerase [Planctomycetota bacterium]
MKVEIVSGTGNTFALVDAFEPETQAELADPAALATAMVRASGRPVAGAIQAPSGSFTLDAPLPALDGLLVLGPSSRADVRMTLYNADGSRPETCGNGLRAAAHVARAHGRVRSDLFTIECDAGVRHAERLGGEPPRVRVSMGVPKVLEARAPLSTSRGTLEATLVDVGNPHCVLFVPDLDGAPVTTLGPELEKHPRFPARTNVEFVEVTPGRMRLRVWERGVGETAACGSGACAAAAAFWSTGRGAIPPEIELLGGVLVVEWDGAGEIRIVGEVRVLARGEWGRAAPPTASVVEAAARSASSDGKVGAKVGVQAGVGPSETNAAAAEVNVAAEANAAAAEANVVLVPHAEPMAKVRERILALAARHSVRVESDDGTTHGVLAKTIPFLGRAAVRYEIRERSVALELVDRPRGLPEELVKRTLVDELARALET